MGDGGAVDPGVEQVTEHGGECQRAGALRGLGGPRSAGGVVCVRLAGWAVLYQLAGEAGSRRLTDLARGLSLHCSNVQ